MNIGKHPLIHEVRFIEVKIMYISDLNFVVLRQTLNSHKLLFSPEETPMNAEIYTQCFLTSAISL